MILDLTKLDSYVINLDDQPERLNRVSTVLNSKNINFKRHKGVNIKELNLPNAKPVDGCAMSHLQLLSSLKTPFIVFEDDVEMTEDWQTVIDVPDNADAVNLGASTWGYVRPNLRHAYNNVVSVTQHTKAFKKAHNMCSTHGIVYLTDKFRLSVISSMRQALETQTPFDLHLAKIQKDFVYLIPNKPFIYQKDLPQYTNVELKV